MIDRNLSVDFVEMIIPIRCFTCNKVIAHLWEEYNNQIQMAYIEKDIANDPKKRFVNIEELEKRVSILTEEIQANQLEISKLLNK